MKLNLLYWLQKIQDSWAESVEANQRQLKEDLERWAQFEKERQEKKRQEQIDIIAEAIVKARSM
jgi:hypothetical protein